MRILHYAIQILTQFSPGSNNTLDGTRILQCKMENETIFADCNPRLGGRDQDSPMSAPLLRITVGYFCH